MQTIQSRSMMQFHSVICPSLETSMQQIYFEDWLKACEDIPVFNVLTIEEIAGSVKITDHCENWQDGVKMSDSEYVVASNDSTLKLNVNDVIDKISEVMGWMQRQGDFAHKRLMHLATIKQ